MIIDYSVFRPAMSTLQHAGVTSVGRYLGWDCEPGHACIRKNLTKPEAAVLHAAGISVFLSFEYTATAASRGAPQGTEDAQLATRQLAGLGAPPGAAVYYSVDFDLPDYAPKLPNTAANARAKLGPAARYFDAIHATKPAHAVGAYGGYWAVKRLFDAGLIKYGWQTAAWSGGQWDPRAQLRQLVQQVFGAADVDVQGATGPDWGQWPRPASGSAWDPVPVGAYWRNVADGSRSLAQAAGGGMPLGLLEISSRMENPANRKALNAYLTGPGGVNAPMPRGLVYYTYSAPGATS